MAIDTQKSEFETIKTWKDTGHTIVFTNGCFDILHDGHIHYLTASKNLGDKLVVGLNSDASVKRLKGDTRPILNQQQRSTILSALRCVDLVIIFEEDTPIELIKTIQPDIHTKGGDYTAETLPETAIIQRYGGTVKILPYLDGRSTTQIIQSSQL